MTWPQYKHGNDSYWLDAHLSFIHAYGATQVFLVHFRLPHSPLNNFTKIIESIPSPSVPPPSYLQKYSCCQQYSLLPSSLSSFPTSSSGPSSTPPSLLSPSQNIQVLILPLPSCGSSLLLPSCGSFLLLPSCGPSQTSPSLFPPQLHLT